MSAGDRFALLLLVALLVLVVARLVELLVVWRAGDRARLVRLGAELLVVVLVPCAALLGF